MTEIYAELWTRPGDPNFGRKRDYLPFRSAGIHVGLNKVGDGNFEFADSFDGFDDILATDSATPANSESSLVRWFSALDPTTPIADWLPSEILPGGSKDDPYTKVTGIGINGILGYARLEAFDWDGSDQFAPRDPDWLYGGTDRVQNGGLEDNPLAIANPGFEDGTLPPWWAGAVEGFSANASVVTTAPRTGTFHASVTALLQEGGMSTTMRVFPGKTYTVSFWGRTDAGSAQWQLGASGPSSMGPGSGASLVEVEASPGGWEVQANLTHTTTYTQHSVTFTAGPNQTSTQISIRYADASPPKTLYVDDITVTGFGIGTDPWEIELPDPTETFEASMTQAHTGSWSLEFGVEPGGYVYQTLSGVEPGVTYSASVWVFGTAGEEWAFEARDARNALLAQDFLSATGGTWEELTFTFTVPDFLPGADGAIQLRIVNANTAVASAFVDDLVFFQGQLADTVGKILGDLYDDATVDHVADGRLVWEDDANPGTAYLTLDFTDSVDSAGNAWADPEISTRLTMRQSYSQIMAHFSNEYGYEYRIVADDVEAGTWLWQVYNPGGMDAAPDVAVQGGSSDVKRQLRRVTPSGTDQLVEGLERVTARARNTNLLAALGRIEASALAREVPDLTAAASAAGEAVAQSLQEIESVGYVLTGDLQDEPLSAYTLGDTVTIVDPPDITAASKRFIDLEISVDADKVEWEAQYGALVISNADAAVADAVAGLLKKFEYPDIDPPPSLASPSLGGGGGGAPTVVVAASDASDLSKSKADFVCTGVNDDTVIMTAISVMPGFGVGGRVLLTEGTFNCRYGQIVAGVNQSVTIQGMGQFATRVVFDGTSGSGFDISSGADTICDLRIDDTGSGTGPAIRLHTSAGGRIDNVLFDNSGTGIEIATGTSAAREVAITRCFFRTGGFGIDATPTNGRGLLIVGNHFENTGSHAITASNIEALVVVSNFINIFSGSGVDSVVLSSIVGGVVASNVILTSAGTGIRIASSDNCDVVGNWVKASTANIRIQGTASRNFVSANVLRGGGLLGVDIADATCNCNIVVGNDFDAPSNYTTDALNDAGTDTQLTYPNDPTYGDNFTDCPASS